MRQETSRNPVPTPWNRISVGVALLGVAGFWACANSVVFVSPDYPNQRIQRVAMLGLDDFTDRKGSGAQVADIYEKYLLSANYHVIERRQVNRILHEQRFSISGAVDSAQAATLGKILGVDALVLGSVSEYTDAGTQTMMVNTPQEQTTQDTRDVPVQDASGNWITTQQKDAQTVTTDQLVPETTTTPARVGVNNVRMVSVKTGELMWSGSASASGRTLALAAERASSKVMRALQEAITKQAPGSSTGPRAATTDSK